MCAVTASHARISGHENSHFLTLRVKNILCGHYNDQFFAHRVTAFNTQVRQVVPIQGHRTHFGWVTVTGGADFGTPGVI